MLCFLSDSLVDQNPGIDASQSELRGIDWQWSELIGIGINTAILISIDRHWLALGRDQGSPRICIFKTFKFFLEEEWREVKTALV